VPNNTEGEQQLPWFGASFALTVGCGMLISGRLGDVYGYRNMVAVGYVIFAVSSALLGLAAYVGGGGDGAVIYFIILRALQGLGPAITVPNSVALLSHAFHGHRKTLAFALYGATAPLGFVLGAVFSSLFAQLVWWPWAFWVLGMVCVLLAGLAFLLVPQEVGAASHPEAPLDVLGASVGVTALVLIVYAFNEGPIVGWDRPYVYLLLLAGLLALAAFVWLEGRLDPDAAIMPLDIWWQPGFAGVLLCLALGWGSFGTFIFYTLQLLQVFRGDSVLLISAEFAPVAVSGLCATLFMSWLHRRVSGQVIMGLAELAFCLGSLLIAVAQPDATYWSYIFCALLAAPFGMDMSFPAASLIVSNALPRKRQGVGASLVNTTVNVSISLGLGIASTVQAAVQGGDALRGQRGALYTGIGMAGAGLLCAVFFALRSGFKAAAPALPPTPQTPSTPVAV